MVDEANIETHGMKPTPSRLTKDPAWQEAHMERLQVMGPGRRRAAPPDRRTAVCFWLEGAYWVCACRTYGMLHYILLCRYLLLAFRIFLIAAVEIDVCYSSCPGALYGCCGV